MKMSSKCFEKITGSFRNSRLSFLLISKEEYTTIFKEFLLDDAATRIYMLRPEPKIDVFIYILDGFTSACNLLKIICINKPNIRVIFRVEGNPMNYFVQSSNLDSTVGNFLIWGYVNPDGKVGPNGFSLCR